MTASITRPTLEALAALAANLDSLSKDWPDYFDIEVTVKLSGFRYAAWSQEDGETEWIIGGDDT